ncbi:hypothetical protein TNIN_318291 [Trichonephila inaurata madagascariensis]|uniref:Uncharacterized protein n=1 Tax=Trichonephila inaurata madagascariensis TaxID=2747483 RepID=A0A8X7C7B5_9ARAC|nr:hypothetical protein TNIN_318291 [Trichonephila inaurata madagascariensis]
MTVGINRKIPRLRRQKNNHLDYQRSPSVTLIDASNKGISSPFSHVLNGVFRALGWNGVLEEMTPFGVLEVNDMMYHLLANRADILVEAIKKCLCDTPVHLLLRERKQLLKKESSSTEDCFLGGKRTSFHTLMVIFRTRNDEKIGLS